MAFTKILGPGIATDTSVQVGVVSASNFIGALTGNATGLSGTPNITVGIVTATSLNASGVVTASSFSGSGSGLSGVSTNFVTAVGIQSAGTVIGAGITQLNFIGAGNTFAVNGTTVNISIAGGSGGASGVSSTGILTCRGIANAEDIIESITLNDFYGSGTNYAMVGPITVSGAGTTVTVGAGVSYVII
jgi:hypothetical protein